MKEKINNIDNYASIITKSIQKNKSVINYIIDNYE